MKDLLDHLYWSLNLAAGVSCPLQTTTGGTIGSNLPSWSPPEFQQDIVFAFVFGNKSSTDIILYPYIVH